jgi:hypothetical protein
VQGRQTLAPAFLEQDGLIETRMADPAAYAQAQIDEWHIALTRYSKPNGVSACSLTFKVKFGHCDLQNRPPGMETGSYLPRENPSPPRGRSHCPGFSSVGGGSSMVGPV